LEIPGHWSLSLDPRAVEHANPDRAGHTGAVVGAVAVRVLVEVLLVIVLGLNE
jgi:hypothetical protein